MKEFGKYYEASEPGRRERAYGWATAIGLQDVDGLKPSQYLIDTAKRNIEGEISAGEARRLVDEYYEVKGEYDIPDDTVEADKVSARINQIIHAPSFRLSPEYYLGLHGKIFDGVFKFAGEVRNVELTKREWVFKDLHRHGVATKDAIKRRDDGVRYALTETEEKAVKAILRDSRMTAMALSGVLSVKKRQAERIIASLKKKAGLKRRVADKNGYWVFDK